MENIKPKYEWTKVNREKQYSIIVSCHYVKNPYPDEPTSEGPFRWCVYLVYSLDSKLNKKIKDIHDIPFHGGVTYDRIITTEPYEDGYRFPTRSTQIKIGADYNHLYDTHFTIRDPANGVPISIERDIQELEEYIENILT